MNRNKYLLGFITLIVIAGAALLQDEKQKFISYSADPAQTSLFWKDDKGQLLGNFQNLKTFLETKKQKLLFAMNAGMYMQDQTPLGLFVENGKTVQKLNTRQASGNFYLKPNGVFYITNSNQAVVSTTEAFKDTGQVKFATQSGPMLLIDGNIHPEFKQGSPNLNIRNGVGILPGNKVLFAISKEEVNFYEFAEFFKSMGCKNALYLDGFVSRAYCPEKNWEQMEGNFGVMIGVVI